MGFTHLHLHTEYSLLDGATKVCELFEHVKSLGQSSVAITEYGNTISSLRFQFASLSVRFAFSSQTFGSLSVGSRRDPWRGI